MSTKLNPVVVMEPTPEQYVGDIMLGGKLRKVAVNANAIIDAEEIMGTSIGVFASGGARASHMRAIVYCALQEATRLTSAAKKKDPKLTVEEVGSWLTTAKMSAAVSDIMALLRKFRGDDVNVLAPYVPTPELVLDKALELVPVAGLSVVDLGCGQGHLLKNCMKAGAASVAGYELDEERFWITKGKLLTMRYEENVDCLVHVTLGNLQDADVTSADVVYIYLLQDSNQKIKQWLGANMKKGAKLISHDFSMDGWTAAEVAVVETPLPAAGATIKHRVLVYEIGHDTPVEDVE